MILGALILAASPPMAVPSTPEAEREIVVIGNKLRRWKANIREAGGGWQCKIVRSSGDAEIDEIGCNAMMDCYPPMRDRMVALTDKAIPKATRKASYKAVSRDLTKCVGEKRRTQIAELAQRRRAR